MAVRTAMPATESTGDVWSTTLIDKLPGGQIGYGKVTANQAGITTQADVTSLTTGAVTVNTSRRVRVDVFINLTKDATPATVVVYLMEGATQLNAASYTMVASGGVSGSVTWSGNPSAGAHTYKVQVLSGSGAVTAVGSATQPMEITVSDVGPAF